MSKIFISNLFTCYEGQSSFFYSDILLCQQFWLVRISQVLCRNDFVQVVWLTSFCTIIMTFFLCRGVDGTGWVSIPAAISQCTRNFTLQCAIRTRYFIDIIPINRNPTGPRDYRQGGGTTSIWRHKIQHEKDFTTFTPSTLSGVPVSFYSVRGSCPGDFSTWNVLWRSCSRIRGEHRRRHLCVVKARWGELPNIISHLHHRTLAY